MASKPRSRQIPPTKMPGLHTPAGSKRCLDPPHERARRPASSAPRVERAHVRAARRAPRTATARARARSASRGSRCGSSVTHDEPERGAAHQRAAESRRPRATARELRSGRPDTRTHRRARAALAVALRVPQLGVVLDHARRRARRRAARARRPRPAAAAAAPPKRASTAPAPPRQRTSSALVLERRRARARGAPRASRVRVVAARRSRVAVWRGSGCSRTATSRISAERAERAGEELGEVVARHVLDHLAARLGHACRRTAPRVMPSTRSRGAAVAVAQRAGVAGGDHAADRGAAPVAQGGSSASIWPAVGERAPARAASGTPASSTAVRSPSLCSTICVEPGGGDSTSAVRRGVPHPSFVPPPADRTQRPPRRSRAAAPPAPAARRRPRADGHQNRSAMPGLPPAGAAGTGPGTSPHSRGVGITLPGLARPPGSNAQRSRWNASRSGSSNIFGM